MGYGNFYELDAWKRARKFRHLIMGCIASFPAEERYELGKQLRRAVRSIQANIAEGHGRQTFKDEHHFLIIARGSHAECLSHLIEAFDSGYISADEARKLKAEWDSVGQVLNGYLRFVQSQINLSIGNKPPDTVKESEMPYLTEDFDSENDDSFDQILDEPK